jgi:hypothetical protein
VQPAGAYAKKWRDANPEAVDAYNRSVNGRYAQLKRAAKRASRSLEIELEAYTQLVYSNTCHYCGGPLSEFGYSVDRLDHTKGYTKDNCVPCCGSKEGERQKSCNMRKGHLECIGFTYPRTVELLMELIKGTR